MSLFDVLDVQCSRLFCSKALFAAECRLTYSGSEVTHLVGCVAQWAERRSLAGELTLSCARPAADG